MTLDLAYPLTGSFLVRNSPADKVPSHGTTAFASAYAIDFVPVDASGRSAPMRVRSWFRAEPPQGFVGFGAEVLAPLAGEVVAIHAGEDDHDAYRGFPSVGYAATQARRARAGWRALAGNHVMIRGATGVVVALCHLRRGSITVRPGGQVLTGQVLAHCGNSGNSTQPHLHLQAMTEPDLDVAAAVPITFAGGLPRNRSIVCGETRPPH